MANLPETERRIFLEDRQIKKALKESEDRYQQLVYFLSDMVLVHSEGKIIFINPAGSKLLGLASTDEITGKAFIDFVHPDYKEAVREKFRQVIVEGRESRSFEIKLMCLSGTGLTVDIVISPFNFQGEWALLIVCHDITGRKHYEEALKESEERFRSVIQNLNGYIYSVFYEDNMAISSFHSPRCISITGYTPEEYANDPDLWIKMVHRDDRTHINNFFMNLTQNRQQTNIEHRIIHKNGSIRWISNTFTVFTDESGELIRLDGFIIDITDRKNAEDALKQQYMLLQKLIDTIPNPIYYKNTEEVFQGCNIAFENFLGFRKEEIIGRPIHELISSEQAERFIRYNPDNFQKSGIQLYETKFNYPDRTPHDVLVTEAVLYNQDNSVYGIVGVMIDITNRKKSEQLLKDSEERYRTLAENSYDLISEVGNELNILYISPNVHELLGYSPEAFAKNNLLDYIHLDDIPNVIRELRKNPGRAILRLKHADGEWIWFESAGKKFTTASGEIRGVIVSRDISERKKLEQQMIQTEKLMAIGEMSAMIAHEFRNALTSVKMIIQLLNESNNLTQKEKNSFGVAVHSIQHMENIVQQLLTFAHPAPVELQIEELNNIIKSCISFVQMQANKKNVEIIKSLDPQIPPIILHSTSIKEMVINLLLNAIQSFSSPDMEGKTITVTTKPVVLDHTINDYDFGTKSRHIGIRNRLDDGQEIRLMKGTECACIEIKDNGDGIDKEHISKIYEPFFTTKKTGSGLGLSIVKRTVNAHGGIILVTSKKNHGTVFKIYLPLKI